MKQITKVFLSVIVAGVVTSSGASAAKEAIATLMDKTGTQVGEVVLTATPDGTLIRMEADRLPAGTHGFHIHETGACTPDFGAAGGHFAPNGNKHGLLIEGGKHAGDLPNIHVPQSGKLTVEVFAPSLRLSSSGSNSLFDENGSAVVIHAGADDYRSQPSGAAGSRIACGVVRGR